MSQLYRTGATVTNYSQIFGSATQYAQLRMRVTGVEFSICSNTSNTSEFAQIATAPAGQYFDLGVVDLSKINIVSTSTTGTWYALINPRNTIG